jgi:hypothetical protein
MTSAYQTPPMVQEDGLALRANLYAKIKATIDQLKSRDAGKT